MGPSRVAARLEVVSANPGQAVGILLSHEHSPHADHRDPWPYSSCLLLGSKSVSNKSWLLLVSRVSDAAGRVSRELSVRSYPANQERASDKNVCNAPERYENN